VTAANTVDYVQPHWNDKQVFLDRTNLQSLCKRHHDIKTAGEDAAKRQQRDG
jgi:5-methylcytosine-specific restriction protein A